MANESVEALERLDVLIGKWQTDGLTTDGPGGPAQRVDAVDTYERLPGGALLHLVDAWVGEVKVEGAEIIGFDAARRSYSTQFFGGEDATAYEATPHGRKTAPWCGGWSASENRFRGVFNAGARLHQWPMGRPEYDALNTAQSWMEITLTKQDSRCHDLGDDQHSRDGAAPARPRAAAPRPRPDRPGVRAAAGRRGARPRRAHVGRAPEPRVPARLRRVADTAT